MSEKAIRLLSGGTIQVREGVLRGAGPLGPTGPVGATGPTGPLGPTGPMGYAGDAIGSASTTSSVAVSSAVSPLIVSVGTPAAEGTATNPLHRAGNGYDLNAVVSGSHGGKIVAVFTSGSGATGRRGVGIYPQGSSTPSDYIDVPVNTSGKTVVVLPISRFFDSTFVFNVRAFLSGSTDALESLTVQIARRGIGDIGPTGPAGPIGATGPTGPQGTAGDSGSGYSTFEALLTGGGSDEDPDDGTTTADQAVAVPVTSGKPALVYWLTSLVTWMEKRIVARYADSATLDGKRTSPQPGEVVFLEDTNSLWVRGASQRFPIAQVRVSVSPAPVDSGQVPGTIWVQI